MATAQPGAHADLRPILHALSEELTALGGMGKVLQVVLSARATHEAGIEDFQALDLVTQRLFVLAAFLDALAPTVTPGSRGDLGRALEGVQLADVARRLGAHPPDGHEPAQPGDLHLFGDEP